MKIMNELAVLFNKLPCSRIVNIIKKLNSCAGCCRADGGLSNVQDYSFC